MEANIWITLASLVSKCCGVLFKQTRKEKQKKNFPSRVFVLLLGISISRRGVQGGR